MPDSLGIPDASTGPLLQAESPAANAGASWAAVTHGLDQAASIAGGFEQLAAVHAQTVDAAQMAKINSNIETQQQAIAGANQYDAGAFQQAAGKARSDFISGLPAQFAQRAAQTWDLNSAQNARTIYGAGIARDHVLAGQDLDARLGQLSTSITNTLSSGAPLATATQAPGYQANWNEALGVIQSQVDGKFISPAQAQDKRDELGATSKAAAFQSHVLQIAQSQGYPAALAEVQRFSAGGLPGAAPPGDGAFEAGVGVSPTERALATSKASAALNQQMNLASEQTNSANAAKLAAQKAMDQQIQNETHYQLTNGKPSGAGPTDASIASVYGWDKVAEVAKAKAAALEQNREDGITPGMTSDQIAQQAATKAAQKPLDLDLSTPEKMNALEAAIRGQEGGVSGSGTPLTSRQGAMGASQIMLATARGVAAQNGIPNVAAMSDGQLHDALMSRDQTLNNQLGHLYFTHLVSKYGDPRLVSLAYQSGETNTDKEIASHGRPDVDVPYEQWLQKVGHDLPNGAQYVQDVADRMGQAQRVTAAQATVQRANTITTEAVNDPLGFGQSHGWGQPPLLTLGAYAQPGQAATFGAQLQARQVAGQALAQAHPGVPATLLTKAEATFYRGQIEANPAAGAQLAAAATSALGPQGAQRLLEEVGQTPGQASVGMQIAWLKSQGAHASRAADAAVQGLTFKTNGAKDQPLPMGQTWGKAQEQIAPAFERMPGALASITQTAQLMHLADTQGGVAKDPRDYMMAAAGGAHASGGVTFGGVDTSTGKPTFIPSWMAQGTVSRALQIVGDSLGPNAPRFANGAPMRGRDLARMQPIALPDGTYALRPPGGVGTVPARDGSPYKLDLEAMKPLLARAGGIVSNAAL